MNRPAVPAAAIFLTLIVALPLSAQIDSVVEANHPEKARRGLALFGSDVRRILKEHCLNCHGGKSTKADFDLGTRKALMESGFVEKTAADSHFMALIRHTEEPHMPFKEPKLSEAEIEKIARWIDLGAPYDKPLVEKSDEETPAELVVTEGDREFWSFRSLKPASIPAVKDEAWGRTAVDRFIRAKQEEMGLSPNSLATKRVLIRRAYFDLLGLPPTPEEVDAFVGDDDPQAWSKLIERLLESEHYGERWARHWMDIARFAESHGYEQDYNRSHAYHYRDFLIKALNSDLPYDEFVKWQLAGDELAPDNPLAMMATGFIGAGVFPTQLTEKEFETARYDELDDIVTTTGVAFLGLSVGCARCHDHKYDPIPSRDYYRLAAAFTTTIRSEIDLNLEPVANQARQLEYDQKLSKLKQNRQQFEETAVPEAFRNWLKTAPATSELSPWEMLKIESVKSSGGSKFERQADGSWLAKGKAPAKEVITITAEAVRSSIQAIRLEALTHDSFPRKGPGRAGNGNFALGNVKVVAEPAGGSGKSTGVKLVGARATHQQNSGELSVAASIDADPISGWAVDSGGIGKDQAAIFDFAAPVETGGATRLTITLTFNHPNTRHAIGRFRLSVSDKVGQKPEVGNVGLDAGIVGALAVLRESAEEDSEAWKTGIAWFRTTLPEWQRLNKAMEDHATKGPRLNYAKVMVSSEGFPHMKHHADGRGFPHFYPKTYFLKRGDVLQKQGEASPGFLQVLMTNGRSEQDWNVEPPKDWERTSYRRATLANWITDTEAGAGSLAARVIVNRLWQHHFGRGIVSTPNDFGFSGERPTHPELLDWLANDLVENGWRLKRLHKLIMTSSVYMQSGEHGETRAKIDRDNAYFWRRAPQRLEAEAIRDSLLAVSGQLDRRMFGPGTLDANMKRRSIYFFIKRSKLIPMMMLFDWPEHLVSIGQRANTTIAPQALSFMNSPQGRAYAEAFAARIQGSGNDSIANGYRLAFGRSPTDAELRLAGLFLQQQSAEYKEAGKANADRLAMIDLCQTLMSMNEFVYVD